MRTAVAWPVERYVIGATMAGSQVCGGEPKAVFTTWPQVAQWAAGRSMSAAVAEVYVIRRDARGAATWTWRDSEQVRRAPGCGGAGCAGECVRAGCRGRATTQQEV